MFMMSTGVSRVSYLLIFWAPCSLMTHSCVQPSIIAPSTSRPARQPPFESPSDFSLHRVEVNRWKDLLASHKTRGHFNSHASPQEPRQEPQWTTTKTTRMTTKQRSTRPITSRPLTKPTGHSMFCQAPEETPRLLHLAAHFPPRWPVC